MSRWYMMDDDKNVILAPVEELASGHVMPTKEYYEWLDNNKIIKQEDVNNCWVSTVFIGLDHSFGGNVPIVFETMIFPSQENLLERDSWRYATYQEALEGHANACRVAEAYGSGIDPEELKRGAAIIESLMTEIGKGPLEEE